MLLLLLLVLVSVLAALPVRLLHVVVRSGRRLLLRLRQCGQSHRSAIEHRPRGDNRYRRDSGERGEEAGAWSRWQWRLQWL